MKAPQISAIVAISLLASTFLNHARGQDIFGVGSFAESVNQAIERGTAKQLDIASQAPVDAALHVLLAPQILSYKASKNELFNAPKLDLEYDFRFNQQKASGGLGTDIDELHAAYSFNTLLGLNLQVQYIHVWAYGSNDAGSHQTSGSNGVSLTITKSIWVNHLSLVLPMSFGGMDTDSFKSEAQKNSFTDSYGLAPFLLIQGSLFQASGAAQTRDGKTSVTESATVPGTQAGSLLWSLAPGYKIGFSDQDFTSASNPYLNSTKGQFNVIGRLDYAFNAQLLFDVSAGWTRYTNISTSIAQPTPALSSGMLGAAFKYTCNKWKLSVGYQYDGFNRDFYQHTLQVQGEYTF